VAVRKRRELTPGDVFGGLIYIRDTDDRVTPGGRRRISVFRCECGEEKEYQLNNVLSGNSKRCVKCAAKVRAGTIKTNWAKPSGKANANMAYQGYRRGAERRGLAFEITYDFFIEMSQRDCYYCGSPPSSVFNVVHSSGPKKGQPRCNGAFAYNGIDRYINDAGYSKANCVPCCAICNRAKSNRDGSEFLVWVNKIADRNLELMSWPNLTSMPYPLRSDTEVDPKNICQYTTC
jgi:hypothetical protein